MRRRLGTGRRCATRRCIFCQLRQQPMVFAVMPKKQTLSSCLSRPGLLLAASAFHIDGARLAVEARPDTNQIL